MHFGICVPNLGVFSDPQLLVEMAQEAEQTGWDGFFIWDHIALGLHNISMVDPWMVLAAIAVKTEHIRFGPMVTPLPRRRPWKVAREAVTLDHLSGGRLILGVGVGNDPFSLDNFGEVTNIKERAAMLDEALEILTGLWSGKPFQYNTAHYTVKDTVFVPGPVQSPRIPIWVAATWPYKAPMRRAARWDGVFPSGGDWATDMSLESLREMIAYINEHRTATTPFDVVHSGGITTGENPAQDAAIVATFAEVGVTWWLENHPGDLEDWSVEIVRERVRKGPPKL